MAVCDEDMPQSAHAQAHGTPLHLGAFSAVYHVEFAFDVQYLAARQMMIAWFGRAASKDMKCHGFHSDVVLSNGKK